MANIIESKKFIFSDVEGNHNKWWEVILYDNDDVETKWSRVGYDPQSKIFNGVGRSFMDKKISEKIKKGYTPAKIVDGTTSDSISIADSNLHEIAKKQMVKVDNKTLHDLVERLVKANIHKITTSTQISFNNTTGLFSTPLGIVTQDAITEARELLSDALTLVENQTYNRKLDRIVGNYLRLIPQNIGMRFNVKNILPDVDSVQKQNDILDSLESSLKSLNTTNTPKTQQSIEEEVFKVDLDILEDNKEYDRLVKWYETSKKSIHGYDRIKVKNIFKINIHEMSDVFHKTDKKIVEVFHGTSQANCLSILKSGLKISPPSTAHIAGKMFGSGIYGAINSSKSLGYTFGKWGGSSSESGWLYICDFAMGRIYETTSSCSKPSSAHDSVWAKASSYGLYHDELIVYENFRANIKYLLECK